MTLLLLLLATGPEDALPRSLSEAFVQAPADVTHEVFGGLYLGSADGVDAEGPALIGGFQLRARILPWLGVDGAVGVQSEQEMDDVPAAEFFQIPLTWSILLYSPIELGPFRFHALGGGGLSVTHVSGFSSRDGTDVNFLACLGTGVEMRLTANFLLVADVRKIWAQGPPDVPGFDADWVQATAGLLLKLPM